MAKTIYNNEEIDAIAEKLNDIFWDAVGEGMNYEQARDEVDEWIGNNYIPDLVDPDTDEVNESILSLVYARVPTEEEYNDMVAEEEDDDDEDEFHDSFVCFNCGAIGSSDDVEEAANGEFYCPVCGSPDIDFVDADEYYLM